MQDTCILFIFGVWKCYVTVLSTYAGPERQNRRADFLRARRRFWMRRTASTNWPASYTTSVPSRIVFSLDRLRNTHTGFLYTFDFVLSCIHTFFSSCIGQIRRFWMRRTASTNWLVPYTTSKPTRQASDSRSYPRQALRGGYFKGQFSLGLSTFGDISPQKRGNGSKNEDGIAPRRALCGYAGRVGSNQGLSLQGYLAHKKTPTPPGHP